jgi:hypothetical protein
MDEEERSTEELVIEPWIYTIGKRGGLYHQYITRQNPPTRIHRSHPPAAHQPFVNKFQEEYLKKEGLVLLKRSTKEDIDKLQSHQPTPQKPFLSIKNEPQQESSQKRQESKKIEKPRIKQEIRKISRKSKPNVEDPIVVIEDTSKAIVLPCNTLEITDNINKLQSNSIKLVPDWVQMHLSRVFHTQPESKIYYTSDTKKKDVKRLATERLLCEKDTCLVQKAFFTESIQKSIIGIYTKSQVSFDNGITIQDVHTYIAYEPCPFNALLNSLSRILLCAIHIKAKHICVDIESSQCGIATLVPVFEQLWSHVKKQNLSIQLQFIGKKKSEIQEIWKDAITYMTLEEALKKQDPIKTLFVSFFDMRYVLHPKSVFHNISSVPLQTYGLTNLHLLDEKNYKVGC